MNFVAELKRRNVFRVAASYAIVAWIVLQVADTTFPALNIPSWVQSLLTVLLLLGLPLALLLAWAFELTPEGIKPTAEVPVQDSIRSRSGQRMNSVIVSGLAILLVLVILDAYVLTDNAATVAEANVTTEMAPESVVAATPAPDAPAPIDAKSIAVLPFANLSDDEAQDYFSDGLTEELINKLSRVDDLLVTGRNSSFYFKGRDDELRDIGQQLGVAHLLQGSVRKAGTQLRISAALLDVETNTNIWSDTWDRELADIFMVQDEIAEAVTTALSVTLRAGEFSQPGMTDNVAAYEEFLQGIKLVDDASNGGGAPIFLDAISHLERAVELDPAFAEGWVRLSSQYRIGIATLPPDQRIDFAARLGNALDQARMLAPELPSYILAVAYQQTVQDRNYVQAESLLRGVLDSPGGATSQAAGTYATFLWVTGRTSEALNYAQQARRLDPKGSNVSFMLSNLLLNQGRIDDALAEIERGLSLGALAVNLSGNRFLAALMRDDRDAAVAALQNMPIGVQDLLDIATLWQSGDDAAALEIVRSRAATPDQSTLALVLLREWTSVLDDPTLGAELLNRMAFTGGDIWMPLYSDIRKQQGFKDYARERGLLDYWRASGNWSDWCRPVNDDFECF